MIVTKHYCHKCGKELKPDEYFTMKAQIVPTSC